MNYYYIFIIRLLINEELGGGSETGYRCVAENRIPEGFNGIPGVADKQIKFKVDSKYWIIGSS